MLYLFYMEPYYTIYLHFPLTNTCAYVFHFRLK